ncbi:helix-turn-helix transcriptional regulator [Pseudomonas sp. OTU750018]|uniref:helix-turn-helix transcriptional regulator n=1 Tax=Pseudomonas sp. OTU750018 TaxID=2709708 RepID=UPI001423D724|nr:AlpA family phage regulatory protein [Pseudomonas sp. OTU750018]
MSRESGAIHDAVSRKVGRGRKTIYIFIREGDFPKQLKIDRASRWLQREVGDWIAIVAAARKPRGTRLAGVFV